MWIITGDEKQLVYSAYVQRFIIIQKPDRVLIVASYSSASDIPPVTLARYKDMQEAKSALTDLGNAVAGGQNLYYMPESRLYYEQKEKNDARTKRKGGS